MKLKPVARLPLFAFLILLCLASESASFEEWLDIDFGLPLFGRDEIRLEKEKAPSFNLQLFSKFMKENAENAICQLHGIHSFVKLIKISDETKKSELTKLLLEATEPASGASKREILNSIFCRGLLLAIDTEPDPENKKDHEFEETLIKNDQSLAGMPEYPLIKGLLFMALKKRPNGYFSPMKPLEDLKQAGSAAPMDPHFHFVLGQAFRAMGSNEETLFNALVCYEKASAMDSGNQKLQNSLLAIYMGLHEIYQNQRKSEPFWLEEAVYKKILTLSPNNPYALNNLGYLYAEYGVHRQEAQMLCQRAVDQLPNNPAFRDSLGWAAFKNGQFEKAELELKNALSQNPDSYDVLYHLGTLYYVRKKIDKAIPLYEKAVSIQPNAADAMNNYAYLLAENDRDLEKALQMAKKAITIEPNNPSFLDTVGWTLFKLGNYQEAERYLKKAFQMTPDVGEILAHLGKLYIQMRQFESGLGYLKQAQKADPGLENIQDEIFFAMNLNALHQILADYHRAFGKDMQTKHVRNILVQIARLYQDEGLFNQAVATNQLCEKLKRGELDFGKPLFDYYSLPEASPSVILTASATVPEVAPPEAESKGLSQAPVFAEIAEVPLALNLGPGFMRFIGRRLPIFDEASAFSISLFVRNIFQPYSSFVIQLELPGSANREMLQALEFNLAFYGIWITRKIPNVSDLPGFHGSFLGKNFWVIQNGDFLLIGCGDQPSAAELQAMSRSFPYNEKMDFGLILDWTAASKNIPALLSPFFANPLGNFDKIYARYWREKEVFKENSQMLPNKEVNRDFMKKMAEDLYLYKLMLFEAGCTADIRVEAKKEAVSLSVAYRGIREKLREVKERLALLFIFLKPHIEEYKCALRRAFFGRNVNELDSICPTGGKVVLNPSSGALCCSQHSKFPQIFPLIGVAKDRCAFSRKRLEGLIKLFSLKTLGQEKIEGLIKKFLLEYNIYPCPKGGKFTLVGDEVKCSFHDK